MKLTKKKEKEFLQKIKAIKELDTRKKTLESEIDKLKNDIKAYMDKNELSELNIGIFTVHYTIVEKSNFDVKVFREAHEELYADFCKPTISKRFEIK